MDINTLRPYGNRVLLRIEHGPTHSKGGLIIPNAEKRRSPLGTVVRIGEDVIRFKSGDLAYFDLHEGMRVDETHLIIKEEFLYATIDKED